MLHIQLAMSEHRVLKVDANVGQELALRFVDCHGKRYVGEPGTALARTERSKEILKDVFGEAEHLLYPGLN